MPHPPQIPLTPQTDERNFPRWDSKAPPGHSGHPYPKMINRIVTRELADEVRAKTQRQGSPHEAPYWDEPRLRVGAQTPITATQEMVDAGFADHIGQEIVVQSEAEETEFKTKFLGVKPPAPAKAVPIPMAYEVAPEVLPQKKKRGRPPKAKVVPSVMEEVSELT